MSIRIPLFTPSNDVLATDIQVLAADLLAGDANSGSSVVDAAGGALLVSEDAPQSADVLVAVGAAWIKDNNASAYLKKAWRVEVYAEETLTVTLNSSGSNRVDAVVLYIDLDGAAATRGDGIGICAIIPGTGTSALSDAAIQTAVDALVGGGYSDVPFIRLADITVPNGGGSGGTAITDAMITDIRTEIRLAMPTVETDTIKEKTAGANISIENVINLTAQPRCQLYRTTNQSIANSTVTAVTWSSEAFDVGDMHAGTESKITIPNGGTGIYLIMVTIRWASNTTNTRQLYFSVNGSGSFGRKKATAVNPGVDYQQSSIIRSLAAGDYIEAFVVQDSGGALNIEADDSTKFTVIKIA